MGKSSGSAPAAPNPGATAAAQAAANKEAVRESALVNQIGTEGPWGRTYYAGDIGSPERRQVTELNDTGQQTFDNQQQIGNTLSGYGQQLAGEVAKGPSQFSLDGLPSAPWEQDLAAGAKAVEDATYQRGADLMRPEFDRQQEALRTQLANQGLTEGSEAYTTEMNRMTDSQNRALSDLSLASVGAGRAEQSRLFSLGSAGRSQALGEQLTERTQPMNELAALLQGAPAIQLPQGVGTAQYSVQPGDVQGATQSAYQGALNNYNQGMAANNAMAGNIFGLGGSLGGAAILASDRRLKTAIRRIGRTRSGVNVYRYRYVGDPVERVGVMAQEVAKIIPAAVHKVGRWLAVDYQKVIAHG
jgi:hypothetical protein